MMRHPPRATRTATLFPYTTLFRAEMLHIEATELEPTALISAILKAPVDLIWFGGIGTYVKAAAEPHIDVGDPGNDRLRVNRSDERRVGKECVSMCRSRWSPYHKKKNN